MGAGPAGPRESRRRGGEPTPLDFALGTASVGRRVIVCDGAELARLWARIGASESEELTWVPREDEPRARPPGFRALQGGLTADAVVKLDPKEGDEFALIS